ncbi:hypothetical protein ALC57_01745 [Trachymyrmex cornetzi]|uniref:Uncharacterized protein n=1 Tax=Trachymyrmex cornetzi TaxID=471704 RepID=A0A195ELH4_9HYME|nr:hypothetical protein ALC57_01745 [Trachymyrmex cornetzi]
MWSGDLLLVGDAESVHLSTRRIAGADGARRILAGRNVDSCRLGAAARFLRAIVPKRGATPLKPGGVGGQINTRYFTGWEMKVCFVPCLQARPRN